MKDNNFKENTINEMLTVLDIAINTLGEIKPLDKSLLDRIDALKQKADELRGEENK